MVNLHPDKLKINGPLSDNGYTVTLYIGEYEKEEVSKLVMFSNEEVVKVTISEKSDG